MKCIKAPAIESIKSLNGFWADMFAKYVDTPFIEQALTEAHEDVQDDIRDEFISKIIYELPRLVSIEYDENEDGKFTSLNADDLEDWLRDYMLDNYILEKK